MFFLMISHVVRNTWTFPLPLVVLYEKLRLKIPRESQVRTTMDSSIYKIALK